VLFQKEGQLTVLTDRLIVGFTSIKQFPRVASGLLDGLGGEKPRILKGSLGGADGAELLIKV
jgi:hypothetical protein